MQKFLPENLYPELVEGYPSASFRVLNIINSLRIV